MEKTLLDQDMIGVIQRKIKELRDKNNVVNTILRDDVFMLLEAQKDCTVLYYPLEDTIEGFRIRKYVGDRREEFIFINTANKEDIQIFTAAHELGHIIGIDKMVCAELGIENPDKKQKEDIIDRFAAELLMDYTAFTKLADIKLKEFVTDKNQISLEGMLRTITFLMDSFMAPYDAVVRRFHEVGKIDAETMAYLQDRKIITEALVDKVSEEGKYKRIKPTRTKSFGDLTRYLEKLDEAGEISEKRLERIMRQFDLNDFNIELPDAKEIQLEEDADDVKSRR